VKVVLYTRDDCGLCQETDVALSRAQKLIHFDFDRVYIDNDEELRKLYGDRVPVVMIDGKEVASAPVDEGKLLATLRAQRKAESYTIL
jgi:glutaredoxin